VDTRHTSPRVWSSTFFQINGCTLGVDATKCPAKSTRKLLHTNYVYLLTKLYKYVVHGDLLNWCRDYLTERQQRVVVKGEASDWLTVTSGVPRGSLLGPLFFIVYSNDLPGVISKDSSIALHDDDSKMYRVISTQEDLSYFSK